METGDSQGKRLGTPGSRGRPGMPYSEKIKKFKMRLLSVLPHKGFGSISWRPYRPDKLLSFILKTYGLVLTVIGLRDWRWSSSCKWSLLESESVSAATSVPQMGARPARFACLHRQALIARVTHWRDPDALYGKVLTEEQCWTLQRPPMQARERFGFAQPRTWPTNTCSSPQVCTACLVADLQHSWGIFPSNGSYI